MEQIPNEPQTPDDFDALLSDASANARNKFRLRGLNKKSRQAAERWGYIPFDCHFLDEQALKRNLAIEKRSASGNLEMVRVIEDEIARNAAEYAATKRVRKKSASNGGKATALVRQPVVLSKHAMIVKYAKEQISKGKKHHELASICARKFEYSDRRVRDILKASGVLEKKNGNAP